MTTIRILPIGTTTAFEPEFRPRNYSPQRGDTTGWNKGVSGRLRGWLSSIDADKLTGYGYAFTFTVRDCPGSAAAWSAAVKELTDHFRRRGAIRWSWLTEWQKRGAPHLHGVVYFPIERPERVEGATRPTARWWLWSEWEGEVGSMWLQGCKALQKWGSGGGGQDVKAITKIDGWLMYLAKHAGRGQASYQRQAKSIPVGWSNTGRMWGKGGDWPTVTARRTWLEDDVEDVPYFRLRKSWQVAQARGLLARAETPRASSIGRHQLCRCRGANKHPKGRRPYGTFAWMPAAVSERLLGLCLTSEREVLDEGTGEITSIHPPQAKIRDWVKWRRLWYGY